MKDGKCTKGFPKPLAEATKANLNGFPEYRRRRRPAGVLRFGNKEYSNDTINQWVVPYNAYLTQKYDCHINCEICTALSVLKYLFKYVYKGSDRVVISVEAVETPATRGQRDPNEILRYLNSRYVSPVEACMRLLDYSIQGKTHAITQLTIHLEDQQVVTFRSSDDPARLITTSAHTMLTRFFELCASDAPENQIAKTMLYKDIPKAFWWKSKSKRWVRRERYQAALGRLVHVSPRDEQRFNMRVLLCHRKGPTSFRDLRTADGVYHESYQLAALAAGFLEDDNEWVSCMSEAAHFRMPYELRQLFATMIVYCQMASVRRMWDQFYDDLSEDFARPYRDLEGQAKDDMVKFNTLKSLNELLESNGTAVADFDLPQLSEFPALVLESLLQNSLIRREMQGYDHTLLQATVDEEGRLNDGQRAIYDKIIDAVETPTSGNKTFFIDGPGGTGKSTLLKHILAKVRLSGKIALAVASSGIASLLLMGGCTAHSTFRIPLKLTEQSTCSIYKSSPT